MSLRAGLLTALAILLLVALFAVAAVLLLWLPRTPAPAVLVLGLLSLVAVDVVIVVALGDYLLQRMFIRPLARMVQGAEAIAEGDTRRRLEESGPTEVGWLAESVNRMADRLIRNQEMLAENVRSLDRTNQELNEARRELVHSEKLASVGRLAAGVAHEVGNPLGAILGYVEVARRRGGSDSEWIDHIEHEAERIDRVVRGLLDFARPKPPSTLSVEIGELVNEAVELLERQGSLKRARVDVDLAGDQTVVRGDPGQLEQVLVNLLLNAADATDEVDVDGRITVRTAIEPYAGSIRTEPARRKEDPEGVNYSHLRSFRRDLKCKPPFVAGQPVVTIEVTDNGSGIDSEDVDRVFEPFYTTKDPGRGTGLGLAVCARLIEEMGGSISAGSSPGTGTTFSVLLPSTTTPEKELT